MVWVGGLIVSNVTYHGTVSIPQNIIDHSHEIKFENYKVNTPSRFQKRFDDVDNTEFKQSVTGIMGIDINALDYVYFSVCEGAEPHTDDLDPKKFSDSTFVIPVLLPDGKSTITVGGESIEVHEGGVYEFNHTIVHSMELEDTSSGCVVIMASELL